MDENPGLKLFRESLWRGAYEAYLVRVGAVERSLIWAIARNDRILNELFEDTFQYEAGWWRQVSEILQRGTVAQFLAQMAAQAGPSAFQALFVACWIHHPVEKGAFMIRLTSPEMYRSVLEAFNKLPKRWSSHLSKNDPRSAGAGFRFLKGYGELLVQIEVDQRFQTPYLFLKAEGHSAVSIAHLASWFTKTFGRDGAGNTQSDVLHDVAEDGRLGVEGRAAENYHPKYQSVLNSVGLGGKQVTIHEAIPEICKKLETKAQLVNVELWTYWKQTTSLEERYSNDRLAELIEYVIIPTANQSGISGKFIGLLREAEPFLASVARRLEEDSNTLNMPQVPRVFEEVRITPEELGNSLREFKATLLDMVIR